MTLPSNFQFSQNSLQDYVDCQRRFQLRYLLRQPWPAVASEPLGEHERLLELGRRFHRLAEQHNLGVSEQELRRSIDSDELRRWWRNYLETPPPDLPLGRRYPEITLSTPLLGYRLVAKYDLLAVGSEGRVLVVDWKTNQRRPDPNALRERLQTRVYCYVAVEAGSVLYNNTPIPPEQVTMVYWFSEFPAQPELLRYGDARHANNARELHFLAEEIAAQAERESQEWPLTDNAPSCRFCTYRSLCDRGVVPGPVAESDVDFALDLNLEFDLDDIRRDRVLTPREFRG